MCRAARAITGLVDRLPGWLDRLFVMLALSALGVSLALNIANLVVRNLFGHGLRSVFSWTLVLFVWMVFLSFYPIYRRRIDIAVDVIVRRLPPGGRRAMRLATDALGLAVVGVVLASAPTIFATQVGIIDFVGLPRYSLSVPLLASCVLIAGDFAMDALHTLLGQEPPHMSEEAALSLL